MQHPKEFFFPSLVTSEFSHANRFMLVFSAGTQDLEESGGKGDWHVHISAVQRIFGPPQYVPECRLPPLTPKKKVHFPDCFKNGCFGTGSYHVVIRSGLCSTECTSQHMRSGAY